MKNTLIAALCSLLLGTTTWAATGDSFPGIEALMTAEEYSAAGIGKLTTEERAALNRWLIRYTAEDSQVFLNSDEQVLEAVKEQEVLSSIVPPFKGWSGKTVFRLENGQVWEQRRRGNYVHTSGSTEVRITKNFMGFYRMELLESGKSVQVQRLK